MTATRAEPAEALAALLPPDAVTSVSLDGLGERPLAAPGEPAEWTAVLRRASEEGWRLLVRGSGSSPGQPPRSVDLVLSTRNHRGVTSYEPGDGTLSARAGSTMAELAGVVAAGGHRLTPDVPFPERATLGGVLAAGRSGLDRLRFGPVRHNVLGMRVCLADGPITRTGGQLVKNVTGYDLHRLYCGSRGTPCVILEASLRLYPLPAELALVRASFPERRAALAAARDVWNARVNPDAVCLANGAEDDEAWILSIFLSGRGEVVAHEVETLRRELGEAEELRGAAVSAARDALRDSLARPSLEWTSLPSRLETDLDALDAACERAGVRARVLLHPLVAGAAVALSGGAADVERVHASMRDAPGSGAPPPGLPLMQRIARALDPDGLFPRLELP